MEMDKEIAERYWHKNVIAIVTGLVLLLAISVGGCLASDESMIRAGYVWEQVPISTKTETVSRWVYRGKPAKGE